MRKVLPIGTYQYDNEQAGARKLVNCTTEQATPDSGNVVVLRRMPGIDSLATTIAGARGARMFNGTLYVVAGTSLYSVSGGGASSIIGTIPGTGKVAMSDNGTTLVIVTNPDAYQSDGSTVSKITDSVFTGFGGASDVDFIDGYLVFTAPNSRTTFVSGLNALTFDALDFTTIDGSTDNLVGVVVDHREIIYLKEKTTEIWYNAGNPTGFPMSRSPNGFIEIGCVSRHTVAKLGGVVYWLANDNTVRQLSGSSPTVVSNIGIAKFIESAKDAHGFSYTFEDKHYYVLSLPGVTLEYDVVAQEWHNRETYQKDVWQTLDILEGFDSKIAINAVTGDVGLLNSSTKTEWGGVQRVSWTYQEVNGQGKRLLHDRFEINMGTGAGISEGQGSDPVLELEISDDGGRQFYSFETREMGKLGQYRQRVFWTRLGSSYNRVYRCSLTDPVDVIAFDTNLELREARF